MFTKNKKKTPTPKTSASRLPNVPQLTPDPNFQPSGLSPPPPRIRFRAPTIQYDAQFAQPYQNRPYVAPFGTSPTAVYRPTMESSSSQAYEPYSPINPSNLDMNFEELMFGQGNYSQDYSMGQGSGHGSAPGSTHGSYHINEEQQDEAEEETDSPVEETSPVKNKKPSKRASKAKKVDKNVTKEVQKEWTTEEEVALCKGWCEVSENSIKGNSQKARGFWDAVIKYFEVETGSQRGYDAVVSKWKNRVRPRVGAFSAIIKNIEENHESGTNDLDAFQKACAEYKMIYRQEFTLPHCYAILKDHPGWKDVEMPKFSDCPGRKKSKTSETTSSGGINLNEDGAEQEYRPMGRDRSKAKKKSTSSSSSFVDLVADKFFSLKEKSKEKKQENKQKEHEAYMELKKQEIASREAEARELAQLKREKLELQRKQYELAEIEKRDRDMMFYMTPIESTLPLLQQQAMQEMKMQIKARYNLPY